MDFIGEDALLASGSKDGFIRLWKFTEDAIINEKSHEDEEDILRAEETFIQVPLSTTDQNNGNDFLSLKCSLESVLYGHDGLVSCLSWCKVDRKGECLFLNFFALSF